MFIYDIWLLAADMQIMVYLGILVTRKFLGSQKILTKITTISLRNDFNEKITASFVSQKMVVFRFGGDRNFPWDWEMFTEMIKTNWYAFRNPFSLQNDVCAFAAVTENFPWDCLIFCAIIRNKNFFRRYRKFSARLSRFSVRLLEIETFTEKSRQICKRFKNKVLRQNNFVVNLFEG